MNEIKTGLVMEGGAMRGMFTAGVIDVFMENGITFDAAIGVSAGATFGCNIKSEQPGRAIRYNKKYAHDKRFCSMWSFFKTGDMYGADFCYNKIPNELDIYDVETYRKNPMKFYIVASDCITGKPVYKELETCDEKDLTWMRASASMPLVSHIVEVDGYKLLDGGMTDSIPLKYMEENGYSKNIVILTQPRDYKKKPASLMGLMKIALKKYPAMITAMQNRHIVYNEEQQYVFEREKSGDTFVICPDADLGISRTEKNVDELQRVYDEGRATAIKQLKQIEEFLHKN